jgi:ankyrin repeat protein
MKIHHYAHHGDITGVQQELALGVSIDSIDSNDDSFKPQTPLQCALASSISGIDMVKFLIAQGATLLLAPKPEKSDLHWAVCSGNLEKVQLLLNLGADHALLVD